MLEKIKEIPTYRFSVWDHQHEDNDTIPFQIVPIEQLPPEMWQAYPNRHTFYSILWVTGGDGTHAIDFKGSPY